MELKKIERNKVEITMPFGELAFLSNAINEILEAVEDWEFQTRTGETKQRAREIHSQVQNILKEAQAL